MGVQVPLPAPDDNKEHRNMLFLFAFFENCVILEHKKVSMYMTKRDILLDIVKKVILPLGTILLVFIIVNAFFTEKKAGDYVLIFIICGIPYGIRKVRLWLIPSGFDMGSGLAIMVLQVLIGGLIGVFVLVWRIICAIYYFVIDIIKLINFDKNPNSVQEATYTETKTNDEIIPHFED